MTRSETRLNRRRTLAVGIAMGVPFVAALVYFVVAADHPVARLTYGLAKVFILVWPIVVLKIWLKEAVSFRGEPSVALSRSLVEGGMVGLLIGGVIGLAMVTPVGDVVIGSREAIQGKANDLGFRDQFWLFAAFLAIAHSLLEEYYWRGFVFGQLRKLGKLWRAHLLAGVAFSLHHVVVTTQFFPFVPGLLMGLAVGVGGIFWSILYHRHGHLYGAWVSHLIVDFVLMAIGAELLFGGGK